MPDSVYKVIELIGTSKESWEKAAAAAVSRAGESLRDLRVAEVVKLDLQLDAKGKVEAYRAKVNVSFKFEGVADKSQVMRRPCRHSERSVGSPPSFNGDSHCECCGTLRSCQTILRERSASMMPPEQRCFALARGRHSAGSAVT